MATANAIAATGQAILALIAGAVPRDGFPAAQFELYQAKDFQSPMEEGISLYLYRIAPAGGSGLSSADRARWTPLPPGAAHQSSLPALIVGPRSREATASLGLGDAHFGRHADSAGRSAQPGRS